MPTPMASALRGLGFDVTEMIDAGDNDLRGAIENFRARLSAGDAVGLFYYSGYAAQFEGANFLLPSDFDSATGHIAAADVGATGVPLADLLGGQEGERIADRPARPRVAAARLDQRHRAGPGNAAARPQYDQS